MKVAVTVLGQLVSLFIIVLVSYVMTKRKLFDSRVIKGFSALLTNVGLPALIISSLQVPYSPQLLASLGITFAGLAVTLAVGMLCTVPLILLRKVSLREAGVWLCCGAFPNSVFIGKPIMVALYGEAAAFPASALLFTFNIFCFSVGVFLIGLGGHKQNTGESRWKALLRPLCNLSLISGAIGLPLFLFSIQLPAPVLGAMQMLSNMVTPISMLIIGFSLAQTSMRDLFGDSRVYLLSFVRLIACPIVTALVLRPFVQNPLLFGILVVSAAMPVASTIGVLCEQNDNNPLLCSKTIFVTTLLCIATAPLITALFLQI